MPLAPSETEALGWDLAMARRTGQISTNADLRRLSDLDDAEAVLAAALRHLGGAPAGYVLTGTSPPCAKLLCCEHPVVAPLVREGLLEEGGSLHLPGGAIGVGAGFAFRLGRPFPDDGEEITEERAAEACVSCHLDLHLLGRRMPNGILLNAWTATADFGLDVARIRGPRVAGWHDGDLREAAVSLRVDGNELARGRGADILGSPIAAVAWLAGYLAERDLCLNAGDLVATGSCTGLIQVLPGQTVLAEFGPLGRVTLRIA
ncbi:2-keto-4-pentenoate hydratase [Methylobacterium nodulans]|uniref:Fumarylacetoacetate (FAA) hydrolase n=1 Tax=Methylobacterium nodulans (strain LMG 21967 / CNCM I-2342 / ORS 2060) TaxID=460265 RepID=B8I9J2_METNO|nr:fumarylacetoacetate hydrolase family protein [Methylobacterium nodulans]ACL55245.1 fumarylacetoacetate (FAA) hydrolase [Methylobacterium nodulans ORS 2060]